MYQVLNSLYTLAQDNVIPVNPVRVESARKVTQVINIIAAQYL